MTALSGRSSVPRHDSSETESARAVTRPAAEHDHAMPVLLPADAPLANSVTRAIHAGDLIALRRLLDEHPELATASVVTPCREGDTMGTLLHVLTDWPGHRLNGAATARVIIQAGADVEARFVGAHAETPLHWAASCDDVAVMEALLDAGADIEARGAVIAGGTALSDAAAFGQWAAARLLIERGARSTLWESAALGLMDRVELRCGDDPPPTATAITSAFWGACHGGQATAAEYLLRRGADRNWVGYDTLTPLDAARRSGALTLAEWLVAQGATSAESG